MREKFSDEQRTKKFNKNTNGKNDTKRSDSDTKHDRNDDRKPKRYADKDSSRPRTDKRRNRFDDNNDRPRKYNKDSRDGYKKRDDSDKKYDRNDDRKPKRYADKDSSRPRTDKRRNHYNDKENDRPRKYDKDSRDGYKNRDDSDNSSQPRTNKHRNRTEKEEYKDKRKQNFKRNSTRRNEKKHTAVYREKDDSLIRLNQYIAQAGVCSRREADELISAGLVKVNDEIVNAVGTKVGKHSKVEVNGKVLSREKMIYILMNKPKDCVTTTHDPQGRLTVMDLIGDACDERIFPVGRLDRETTGVLLLTNDGDLTTRLLHPKNKRKKVYQVSLDNPLTKNDMILMSEGIELDDGMIAVDAVKYVEEDDKRIIGLEIHSGQNRVVRRIFDYLGYKVLRLDRVLFAGMTKKNVRRGTWRYLTDKEISFLKMSSQ